MYFIRATCDAIYYLLPPYICLTWSLTASLIAFSGFISNKFTPMPVKDENKKKKKIFGLVFYLCRRLLYATILETKRVEKSNRLMEHFFSTLPSSLSQLLSKMAALLLLTKHHRVAGLARK